MLSKVFEKVLYKRITTFVEKHSVLSSTQYGFRANCSPEHAVLDVVSTCYNNISNKQYTGLIMLDLKKAFDSVTHTILLRKLDHYGIRGNAHKLLSSYLCNRRQYVNINNVNSDTQSINYDVPQGSILGTGCGCGCSSSRTFFLFFPFLFILLLRIYLTGNAKLR